MKKNYHFKKIALLAGLLFSTSGWSQAVTTFNYTGGVQTYTVPAGVTSIQIECFGAQGADHGSSSGGLGGYVSGEMTVTPGQVLEIYVGGTDGYNGGGAAGTGGSADLNGVTGGGASDVRISPYALTERIIVAGGGGGAGRATCVDQDGGMGGWPGGMGGNGGGYLADPGTATGGGNTVSGDCGGSCSCSPSGGGGGGLDGGGGGGSYGPSFGGVISLGGTGGACGETGDDAGGGVGSGGQGGCFGLGGNGGNSGNGGGGGGGGGWYGGGAGGGNWAAGGGGGSSYFDPALTSTAFTNGTNTGDGVVIITELCTGLITTVSADSICEGEEVTLHAESTGAGVITWDGGITDGVAFTPSVGTTTYTATSSDPNDCPFVIDIFVGANPVVDAGSDLNICEGEEATLNGSGTATDWTWDGGVTDGVSFTPPVGTTTYTLTGLIDSTGCSATDMVDVTYNEIDSTTTVSGFTYTANQSGAVYQWVECPGMTAISGATDQTFLPSQDGSYAVIIDLNGCIDTSDCKAILGMGVNNDALTIMTIYPNPTDGNFTVQLNEQLEGTIGVYATDGKLIYSEAINSRNTIDFSLKELENGFYIIQVQTSTENYSIRLIKE